MSAIKRGSIELKDNKGIYLGNSQDASIVYIEGTDTLAFSATNFSGLPGISDYISDAEMTTISGDIVAQIPSTDGFLTAPTISGVTTIYTDNLNFIKDTYFGSAGITFDVKGVEGDPGPWFEIDGTVSEIVLPTSLGIKMKTGPADAWNTYYGGLGITFTSPYVGNTIAGDATGGLNISYLESLTIVSGSALSITQSAEMVGVSLNPGVSINFTENALGFDANITALDYVNTVVLSGTNVVLEGSGVLTTKTGPEDAWKTEYTGLGITFTNPVMGGTITGDPTAGMTLTQVSSICFGDPTTSGSWRLRVDNFVMKLEQYSGAEWQEATSWEGPDLP